MRIWLLAGIASMAILSGLVACGLLEKSFLASVSYEVEPSVKVPGPTTPVK